MYVSETVKSNVTGYELSSNTEPLQAITDLIMEGDPDQKKIMIDHNQHMIVSISQNYTNRGMALYDLIREGNLGLVYALETLEVKSDSCFLTYATQCISQYMVLAIMKQSLSTDSFREKPAHVLSFDNPGHERRMI